jgi:hypothetical protein
MAVITLFWKVHIGLSLTRILILQGVFSAVNVLFEYPPNMPAIASATERR